MHRTPSADLVLSWRRFAADAVPIAASALIALAMGVILASKPIVLVALLAMVIAVVGIWVAFNRPEVAFVGLVLIMALIPTYAAPEVGRILLVPSAAAGWAIAISLGWRNFVERGRVFHPTLIDYAVGTFVLLMVISISFSPLGTSQEFSHSMFMWMGGFLGARLLLAETARPAKLVAFSFAIVTVIVAPIAIAEHFGAANPFLNLDFNSTEFHVWQGQADRFGQVRAEASFGHPIALSMFAASSTLLSCAIGLQAANSRRRLLWNGAAVLGVVVQLMTVSRTGWVMLLVGGILVVYVYGRAAFKGRLLGLAAGIAVAIVLASFLAPSALSVLPGFEKQEAQVTASGDYRQKLLDRALEPGVLHVWGNRVNEVTPFVEVGSATDNAYIILADTWGLLPTFALMSVGFIMLGVVFIRRREDRETLLILTIVGFANLAAIFFVDFITQQQIVIWLLVGCAAVASERLWAEGRSREAAPIAQRTAALERM